MKKTYKIDGMHCTSCSILIEGELEDIGVNARVNYAKATLDVEFDEKQVSEAKLIAAVKRAGYQLSIG